MENKDMLTQKDLEQIDNLMKKRIEQDVPRIVKIAFEDFYDHIFEPSVTRNEQQHKEMVQEIKKMQRHQEQHDEILQEHDKRLNELERKVKINN